MNIDELTASAREVGYSDPDGIRRLARGAVVLTPQGPGVESSHLGSRLGGLPALPASGAWPQRDGRSLAFIAQIDLGSQPGVAVEQGLPGEGLLLFFYDAEQSTFGFDPKDVGSFAVIYVPERTKASVAADWPNDLPEHARYEPIGLASEETVALPPWESVLIEDLNLDRQQADAYHDLLERACGGEDTWASRVLLAGYPDQIQGDMTLECALVAAGLYCDATAYQDSRRPVIRQRAYEWRLLLQVPSAEAAGMMWGDVGCLYYWIREEDLKARRFDRSWMILQCS